MKELFGATWVGKIFVSLQPMNFKLSVGQSVAGGIRFNGSPREESPGNKERHTS